jgi:hypothetical protein
MTENLNNEPRIDGSSTRFKVEQGIAEKIFEGKSFLKGLFIKNVR